MNYKGKKEVRSHQTLRNGLVASIYFELHKNVDVEDFSYNCWYVGLCIGKRRRDNNDWWTGKKTFQSLDVTGDGGLEGLVWAKNQLKAFEERFSSGDVQLLIVEGTDSRRLSAYRWLKKAGFKEGTYIGDDAYLKEF